MIKTNGDDFGIYFQNKLTDNKKNFFFNIKN